MQNTVAIYSKKIRSKKNKVESASHKYTWSFSEFKFLNKATILKRSYQCVNISSEMNFVEVGYVLLYGYINKNTIW